MANIGWNVAIIKDRAREMGINLTEEQANDILNKTFVQSMYGADPNKVMSILQSMKGGGSSINYSGTTITPITPPTQTQTDWASVYQNIVNQLKSTWQSPDTSKLNELSSKINPEEAKSKRLELIPIVSDIYDKLAQRLEKRFATEKARVETEKKWEQGKQAQAAAASGFSSSEGFDAALVRNIGKAYNQKIEDLTEQEGIEQDKLKAEKIKDIKEIEAEAAEAALKGYTLLADINYKIANLKQQQDTLIAQAARDILNAKTEEEKLNWQKFYQNALIDLQNRELELTAEKIKKDLELQERELGLKEKSLLEGKGKDELDNIIKLNDFITDKLNTLGFTQTDVRNIYTTAKDILESVDKNKDKLLSKKEYDAAYTTLLKQLKDPQLAATILQQVFSGLGYGKWRW
ncbi:MAG: hypothetical protein QXZ43_04530 [Candidatus Aenigmatarchaeota archaeon]